MKSLIITAAAGAVDTSFKAKNDEIKSDKKSERRVDSHLNAKKKNHRVFNIFVSLG